MEIIPLINEITNTFNETFSKNLNPLYLESKIRNVGDEFTLKLYEHFLNYIDDKYKNSKERKSLFNVKETRFRTLITSVGCIRVKSTSYYDKKTKKRFVLLREILHLKPYQRLTNEAEYQLVKYAMDENMSQAARHALRNTQISRSTVSKKMGKLDGSIVENITKCENQPEVLYIEMDEIHANLQKGGNKICPAAIVHEGYVLLLLNYLMKNCGKLFLITLIRNMILINLKKYLYLVMEHLELRTIQIVFLTLNSFLIHFTILKNI